MILKYTRLLFILCATCLCATHTFATTSQPLSLSTGIPYVFEPGEPQIIPNRFPWTIKASCTIVKGEATDNLISFTVLRKTGKFNDEDLATGASRTINVHIGTVMKIIAYPGAQVEIVNVGNTTITADCLLIA